ncbi:poly-gamma-glutamate system protein [Myxococcota bacterium]|nr:poly-gamma-glutamate system protein [Myxococcota bacterium]
MKRIYWRPHKISRLELLVIALMSLLALALIEQLRFDHRLAHYEEKMAAAEMAQRAMQTVRAERVKQGWKPNVKYDPTRSGIIGVLVSSVTSNKGYIQAKQTSVNPNFAALIVHFLKEANLQEGDLVAVGFSGSFPALNIATLAALETLKLKPIAITSASASQWGANDPKMLWLDMERLLVERHVFEHRSVAASLGGIGDLGGGCRRRAWASSARRSLKTSCA